jgi:hypothetical protein
MLHYPINSSSISVYPLTAFLVFRRCAELEALLAGARCEIEVLEESVSQMIGSKAAVTGI